jgi:hypothetical protein
VYIFPLAECRAISEQCSAAVAANTRLEITGWESKAPSQIQSPHQTRSTITGLKKFGSFDNGGLSTICAPTSHQLVTAEGLRYYYLPQVCFFGSSDSVVVVEVVVVPSGRTGFRRSRIETMDSEPLTRAFGLHDARTSGSFPNVAHAHACRPHSRKLIPQ